MKEKNFIRSLIGPSIKEDDCYDAWIFFSSHCANGSYQIKGIYFDQYYSPVTHADSFIINISIADIHRLSAGILDASDAFQNKNVPIHERVYVSPPPYYIDWFEKSYPNVLLNRYESPFCLQCMNVIQGKNQLDDNGIHSLMQWLQLLYIRKSKLIMPYTSRYYLM